MKHLNISSPLFSPACFLKNEGALVFLICFYLSLASGFLASSSNTFEFGTSPTVNFTVELSEVLSVVIVLVFNY